jgi:hypothetical protein
MEKVRTRYQVIFMIMLINIKPVVQLRLNVIWVCIIEYLTSRGLHLLLFSSEFKYVQYRYQLPTAFDSKEKHAKEIAFAVGCAY